MLKSCDNITIKDIIEIDNSNDSIVIRSKETD